MLDQLKYIKLDYCKLLMIFNKKNRPFTAHIPSSINLD